MMDHSTMGHDAVPVPLEPAPAATVDHSRMGHASTDQHSTTGALGPYPMTRESSGSAWQPDGSEHIGVMGKAGDWDLMAHGVLNIVFDHQSGRRGDDKAFASGMLMGMARRPLGNGTLQFKNINKSGTGAKGIVVNYHNGSFAVTGDDDNNGVPDSVTAGGTITGTSTRGAEIIEQ